MRLKIVSDGTITGTKVLTEDGQTVGNIAFLSIVADAQCGLVSATMEMINIPFEFIGEVEDITDYPDTEHVFISKQPISIDELLNVARKN